MVLWPRAPGSHVHVVLTDPVGVAGQVLVVNWTTLDEECADDACILRPGDHPAIRHESSMACSRAHLWRADKIAFALANGILNEPASLSPAVLQRVTDGGHRSPELRPEWKALLTNA